MALTTKLEAVNRILATASWQAVSALGETPEATKAEEDLDESLREILSEGWHFNTEYEVPFDPDGSNLITLPSDVLAIDMPSGVRCDIDPVMRGTTLYDRKNRVNTFANQVKLTVIRDLDWDSLPSTARTYVKIRAARKFQDSSQGSQTIHAYTRQDEFEARAALQAESTRNEDFTSHQANGVFAILHRPSPSRRFF